MVVHTADIADSVGAHSVLEKARRRFSTLKHIWADGGYSGPLLEWAKTKLQLVVEIVKRSEQAKGFQILARRWVVERTLAWISRNRRLAKDYESLPATSRSLGTSRHDPLNVRSSSQTPTARAAKQRAGFSA